MHLGPSAQFDEAHRARATRILTGEVAFSTASDTMMGGVLLTAFALHLGASNALIGALAAVTFWAQLLQGPGVVLVERLRARKFLTVVTSLVSAVAPVLMGFLAFLPAGKPAQLGDVLAVAIYTGAGAIGGCAWNAWARDAVSDDSRGRFTGRRSALSSAVGIALGLLAAWLLDRVPEGASARAMVFASLFSVAFVAQIASAWALAQAPEPPMPPPPKDPPRLLPLLREPLRHPNYRRLIAFLASWQFAVNLAQPFFTVFYLQQLGFHMTFAMVLSLINQLATMLTLGAWGRLADRFNNKSVLNVSAPVFIACIAAMVVASQIESRTLAGAYLIALNLVMGAASAGVVLASGNIAQKLSPPGAAASFLALNALMSSSAAGLASLLGGLAADAVAKRALAVVLHWQGPHYVGVMELTIDHWDFYFLNSALLGLYALHRLALVEEAGELDRRSMLAQIFGLHRTAAVHVTGGAALGEAPWHMMMQAAAQRRQRALDRRRARHEHRT